MPTGRAAPLMETTKQSPGVVIVHVVVDEQGKVISIKSSSGPALLRLAAETAARETVLKPVEVEGKPVKASGTLTFEFKL